jgi:predicted Rossmann-fold nucleotide-binding protein
MKTEIDSSNFSRWLATATECKDLVFQSLDLTKDDGVLASLPQAASQAENCIFLGCTLGPGLAAKAACHHALVFPEPTDRPFRAFRHELYSPEELFQGFEKSNDYRDTKDWEIYTTFKRPDENGVLQLVEVGIDEIMARRLHDNFVTDEMQEFLDGFQGAGNKGIVSIMGGHKTSRAATSYSQIAHLARSLTRDGYLVVTGGGPGLMEAGNLGAYFGAWDDPSVLDAAIAGLSAAPEYTSKDWLVTAWNVWKNNPTPDLQKSRSLGVPTWFYGHEPPNVFATHIAKYFENSLREEGLLAIATHGVIFGDGGGGTVQEIFQDGCQNYYKNYGFSSPMILFGSDYWHPKFDSAQDNLPIYPAKSLPAWPLLKGLAEKGGFVDRVSLTSKPEEVLASIRAFKAPWELNT